MHVMKNSNENSTCLLNGLADRSDVLNCFIKQVVSVCTWVDPFDSYKGIGLTQLGLMNARHMITQEASP